jgi:signal transduction histidine kinase/ActR/RegA family two-component response regulator
MYFMTRDDFQNSSEKSVPCRHAFLLSDAEGRILKTSSNAGDILGYPAESIVGRSLCDLLPASMTVQFRDKSSLAAMDRVHLCHEGFDARLGAFFQYHACPTDSGFMLIILDVTARQRALNTALERRADQLRNLTLELTRAEEKERRRIAQILHDHLQQLLAGAKFSMLRLFVRTCDEATRLILQDVSNLLDQSIEASRSLTAELVPPMLYEKGLPDALRWLVRWMREKHGIEVMLKVDERPEELAQELRVMLFQAIRELLFNVAKHAQIRQASVVLSYGDDETVEVRVRDKGVGFDLKARESAAGEDMSGGFGLIALRERLAAIGGQLEIESAAGRGTISTIRVPAQLEKSSEFQEPVPAAASSPVTAGPSPTTSCSCRVLVADDHAIVRQGITRLLRESPGMDVIGEAEDGRQAIELAKSLRPNVVVMDVKMPRINGIDATRIIRRELPGVRIIGLSMYDSSEAGLAMREAGAAAFLAKEAPLEDLLAAIQTRESPSLSI